MPPLSVLENLGLAALGNNSRLGLVNRRKQRQQADKMIEDLNIRTSGGRSKRSGISPAVINRKVVIGKWLLNDSKVLIMDEPTRGIDVGAKVEIYELMNELTENGAGILMISSELPEVLGMSDRVLVMSQGRITGELSAEEATHGERNGACDPAGGGTPLSSVLQRINSRALLSRSGPLGGLIILCVVMSFLSPFFSSRLATCSTWEPRSPLSPSWLSVRRS